MLEPQFPKRFQLLKMHKPFSQDRRAKSSTIVSRNSRLLLRLVIHQRTLTRSTRIPSWFCHISESIEGPISSPLLMDMVLMVNLSVSTLRLSLHRRSNSPLSTHSTRLKLTRELSIPPKLRSSSTNRSLGLRRASTKIQASTLGSLVQPALVFSLWVTRFSVLMLVIRERP